MRKRIGREAGPFIVITAADQLRLTDVAMTAPNQAPDVAEELLSEIERTTVVPTHAIPANVVQMDSTVEFATEGVSRRITLVFPGQADITAARISVVTPIGAALSRTLRGSVDRVDDAGWPRASPHGVWLLSRRHRSVTQR